MSKYDRATQMLRYVPGYYRESRVYNAHNSTKGEELNIYREVIDSLLEQFLPQTATWGIRWWEELCGLAPKEGDTLEQRRQRVMSWLQMVSPVTVAVMHAICANYITDVFEIVQKVAPYTFLIDVDMEDGVKVDVDGLVEAVEEAKPAHLAYTLTQFYETGDRLGMAVFISTHDTETLNTPEDVEHTGDHEIHMILGRGIVLTEYHSEQLNMPDDIE